MTAKKPYTRILEIQQDVEQLFESGITRGVYCGFDCLHEYFTLKMGGTTYLYGSPFSGKTEWWLDILVTLSKLYGYKHVIYSPESGSRAELAAELISKWAGKQFYKQLHNVMETSQMYRYMTEVDQFFFIVDPSDKEISIEDFYGMVTDIEQEYNVRINTTLCDPFNELKHDFGADGRQDLYIESKLGMIRRDAKAHNRHNVVITHCTDQQQLKGQDEFGKDVWFYPPPTPRQIAGGQAWYRKAMNLICVYRPPAGMKDNDGTIYKDNEVHIVVQKFKPKGVGKRGTVRLYFDTLKNRYYELTPSGDKRYAGKQGEHETYREHLPF